MIQNVWPQELLKGKEEAVGKEEVKMGDPLEEIRSF